MGILTHTSAPYRISKFCGGSVNIISFLLYFIRRIVIMLRKITRSKMSVIGPFAKKKPCGAEQSVPFCTSLTLKLR